MRLAKCLCVVALILAARTSRADVLNIPTAQGCIGETPDMQAHLLWTPTNGQDGLLNNGGTNVTIHCPIVKTTSNTNISDDALDLVGVTFNASPDQMSTCDVKVWEMAAFDGFNDNNGAFLEEDQGVTEIPPGITYVYVNDPETSYREYWGSLGLIRFGGHPTKGVEDGHHGRNGRQEAAATAALG
jgi:hypothetical protein